MTNMNIEYGRVPPQAIDFEEYILGSLLMDKRAHFIIDKLTPEMFYKEAHLEIFDCIKTFYRNNIDIDLLTITESLRAKGKLDEVGGSYFITKLTSNVGSSSHIGTHIKILVQKYIQREIIRNCTELIEDQYDFENDINDSLNKLMTFQKEIDKLVSGNVVLKDIHSLINESKDQACTRMFNHEKGIKSGIFIPFDKLHDCIGGWQRKDLVYIAARPGMGKTALAIFLAKTAVKKGSKVLFFSLEMSDVAITDRAILGESEINPNDWKIGKINENSLDEVESIQRTYKDKSFIIIDKSSISANEIMSVCRKENPDIIFIDYIQLMRIERSLQNRNLELGEISHRLKEIAKEFNIPVIAMAQLNRDVEKRGDKRPMLSDLRDSGELEQDADVVIMLYRNGVYDVEDKSNEIEILIRKHRNGRVGTVTVIHNIYMNNFQDKESPF